MSKENVEVQKIHPPAPKVVYAVYHTNDAENGESGYMMQYNSIEDAVVENPDSDIYEMPIKNLGQFTLTVKKVLKKKTNKKTKGSKKNGKAKRK